MSQSMGLQAPGGAAAGGLWLQRQEVFVQLLLPVLYEALDLPCVLRLTPCKDHK